MSVAGDITWEQTQSLYLVQHFIASYLSLSETVMKKILAFEVPLMMFRMLSTRAYNKDMHCLIIVLILKIMDILLRDILHAYI